MQLKRSPQWKLGERWMICADQDHDGHQYRPHEQGEAAGVELEMVGHAGGTVQDQVQITQNYDFGESATIHLCVVKG